MSRRLTTEEFIRRAKEIHKDENGNPLYDYSKVDYVSCRTKVKINCPKHGSFWQTPADHLRGKGCRKCGMIKLALEKRKSKEEFVKQALEIHKDKYDYSLVEYVNNRTKVKIICRKCNRVFEITPKDLLRGQGCPFCSKTGIDLSKPVYLYFVEIIKDDVKVYKLGITNYSVYYRFIYDEDVKVKELKVWKFEDGRKGYEVEQMLLDEYKDYKYHGKDILRTGNTELFSENILDKIEKEVVLCQ